MNEELKILTSLMNRGGKGAQALSNPDDPTDIEPVSMQETLQPEVQGGEIELTKEMKKSMPVVNKARDGGNPISGAADFLSNPEVQNALINFGQAFANAGNYSGQDNPINQIGDAGKQAIRGNANQKALQAFEEGKPISETAGRFADPELVANLQARAQQADQFEEELEIAREGLDIEASTLQADTAYKFASLTQNKDLALRELKLMEQGQKIEEKLTDARTRLADAQTELAKAKAGTLNQEDIADLVQARSEYLTVLTEQRGNLLDRLDVADEIVSDIEDGIFWEGNFTTDESGVKRKAQQLGIRITDENGELDMSAIAEKVKNYKDSLQEQLNAVQENEAIIRGAQASALGGEGSGIGGGDTGDGDSSEDPFSNARGTRESPVSVSGGLDAIKALPPGSYGISEMTGETYFIDENGEARPLQSGEQ